MMDKNCFMVVVGIVLGLFWGNSSIYATENLIKNGGFEKGEEYFYFPKKGVQITTENPHSGKRSLLITGPTHWRSFTNDAFKLKPDTFYTISFWYRTGKASLTSSEQVFLPEQSFGFWQEIRDSADKKIVSSGASGAIYPSTEWRERKGYFYSRDNTDVFIKFASRIPSGNLYIDDLSIIPREDDVFQGNLIKNGDFEEEYPYHWNAGSGYKMKDTPVPTCFLDKKSGFLEGNQSLRMDCKEQDAFQLSSGFTVRNGKTYTYSLWMKSSIGEMPVHLWFSTSHEHTVKHLYKASFIKVDEIWKQYKFKITIPDKDQTDYYDKGRVRASLVLRNDGIEQRPSGTFWIDEVEVYEVANAN